MLFSKIQQKLVIAVNKTTDEFVGFRAR